jgi:glutamate synthase domain-containing protein 1
LPLIGITFPEEKITSKLKIETMYEIIESINYRGNLIYQLVCDGEYINTHISDKNIEKFKTKGIDFKDSEGIALYISIYNL